jgi:hypothetical protein
MVWAHPLVSKKPSGGTFRVEVSRGNFAVGVFIWEPRTPMRGTFLPYMASAGMACFSGPFRSIGQYSARRKVRDSLVLRKGPQRLYPWSGR